MKRSLHRKKRCSHPVFGFYAGLEACRTAKGRGLVLLFCLLFLTAWVLNTAAAEARQLKSAELESRIVSVVDLALTFVEFRQVTDGLLRLIRAPGLRTRTEPLSHDARPRRSGIRRAISRQRVFVQMVFIFYQLSRTSSEAGPDSIVARTF
jgi:hypothetical protein